MRVVYFANILVAGWIGLTSLFFPKTAAFSIFSNAYPQTDLIRLVGCLWLAIAFLSIGGIFNPGYFSPVLIFQLIYKSSWLIFVAVPAIRSDTSYPKGMTVFFVLWVAVLPFVIPWKQWLNPIGS